jgi:DNA-binding winged helix-turn-helix (wHTH) protein
LRMLLQCPGELVTRDELRQALWPSDTFVDFEHSLNTGVNRLREILGDDADDPRYIETLSRRGYRFIATIERPRTAKKDSVDPRAVWVHETQGEIYLAQGQPKEALTEMEAEPGSPYHELGLALAYHALGRDHGSDAVLGALISNGANSCAYQIAEVYAYRGNLDQAFNWLNRAYRQRDGGLGSLETDLLLKSLRSDPRYADLLRRMNLPQ